MAQRLRRATSTRSRSGTSCPTTRRSTCRTPASPIRRSRRAGQSTLYVLVPVTHQHRQRRLGDGEARRSASWCSSSWRKVGVARHRASASASSSVVTPADWDRAIEIHQGATFNLAHTLDQMLHLRPHNRFEDLEGVYLVGGGTHPGSGLPVIYRVGQDHESAARRGLRARARCLDGAAESPPRVGLDDAGGGLVCAARGRRIAAERGSPQAEAQRLVERAAAAQRAGRAARCASGSRSLRGSGAAWPRTAGALAAVRRCGRRPRPWPPRSCRCSSAAASSSGARAPCCACAAQPAARRYGCAGRSSRPRASRSASC